MRNFEHRINQIADFESPAVDTKVNLIVESWTSNKIGERVCSADGVE
jgi:hypothetical protein